MNKKAMMKKSLLTLFFSGDDAFVILKKNKNKNTIKMNYYLIDQEFIPTVPNKFITEYEIYPLTHRNYVEYIHQKDHHPLKSLMSTYLYSSYPKIVGHKKINSKT
jgi:hypothetical protein